MSEATALKHLHIIQKTLKAPKGQFNSFGKYKYRNCEDILEAVKPLLPLSSCILLSDTIELIGDRYYIKATATFHFNSEQISVVAYARESLDKKGMDSAQITGATSSYARKYALNGLLLIDDTKDADSDKSEDREVVTQPFAPKVIEKTSSSDNVDWIKVLLGRVKEYRVPQHVVNVWLSRANVDSINELTTAQAMSLSQMIERKGGVNVPI